MKAKLTVVFLVLTMLLSACSASGIRSGEAPAPRQMPTASAAEQTEAPDYEEIYAGVLEQFYQLDSDSEWNDDLQGSIGVLEFLRMEDGRDHIGYTIRDLSGDGIPELVIGFIGEPQDGKGMGREICAVYTCVNGVPVCSLEGWMRNTYMLMSDGNFFNCGSNGAMYHIFGSFALSPDGSRLLCNDYYFTYEKESYDHIGFFYNITGEWDKSKSYELAVSESEFWQIEEALSDLVVEIEMTCLSTLHPAEILPVTVQWAENVHFTTEYDSFTADQSDNQGEIVFTASEEVRDFQLLALTYQDMDEDGNIQYDIREVYTRELLAPDRPLLVKLSFFGTIPNYGFSYVDDSNTVHRCTVSISGRDGSIVLLPL